MRRRFVCFCLLAIGAGAAETGSRRIEKEVRHELVMLPYYGIFDDLAFRVYGDRVELLGAVTRPALKTDAEHAVKHIEGVEGVENKIEVLPLSPQDDRIRLAAYLAIYGHGSLSHYGLQAVPSIHIIVRNGHITLRGVVATAADRNVAGIQANTLEGVYSVVNELRGEERH